MYRRTLISCLSLSVLAALWASCAQAESGACAEATKAYQNALCRWQKGDCQAAEEGFRQAAHLAPNWGAPNARLGVLYQVQGKEQQAREQYALVQTASLAGLKCDDTEAAAAERKLIIDNEAYLLYLVNAARLQDGQSALVPDPTVGVVARLHSEEMRDKNYFDHVSPTPGLANCQERFCSVFGYKPRCIGENVARRWGTLYNLREEKILQSHNELMKSPGHRQNILYPTFEWLGIGIAVNPHGDYWITEVFVESGR